MAELRKLHRIIGFRTVSCSLSANPYKLIAIIIRKNIGKYTFCLSSSSGNGSSTCSDWFIQVNTILCGSRFWSIPSDYEVKVEMRCFPFLFILLNTTCTVQLFRFNLYAWMRFNTPALTSPFAKPQIRLKTSNGWLSSGNSVCNLLYEKREVVKNFRIGDSAFDSWFLHTQVPKI